MPEELVQQVVRRLTELANDSVEIDSMPPVDEGMHFQIPSALRDGMKLAEWSEGTSEIWRN